MPEPQPSPLQPLSPPQLLWRLLKAVVIWLFLNLITFLAVSFIAFSLLNALGMANPDEAFTLAVVCAIPAALTVSSLVSGRKLINLAWQRYRT